MNEIDVSVIITTKNEEDHIGDCLQAIDRQTYPPDKIDIKKIVITYFVLFFIAISVTLMVFDMTRKNATKYVDNYTTFCALSLGLEKYKRTPPLVWKPRLFSAYLSKQFMPEVIQVGKKEMLNKVAFENGIGYWSAMWFFLSCILLIICFKKQSLFFILGLFAAISFGYQCAYAQMVYPWDMVTIFVSVLFIVLVSKDRLGWLVFILPIAVGFKETTMVLCISFLFWKKVSPKRRIMLTIVSLAGCIFVKYVIGYSLNLSAAFCTMDGTRGGGFRWIKNFGYIKNGLSNYIFFLNAGTLLAFIILPFKKYPMLMLKVIAILLLIGLFSSGSIREYRIFFGLIPIALYGIYLYFSENLVSTN